jgi:hypothetical protein
MYQKYKILAVALMLLIVGVVVVTAFSFTPKQNANVLRYVNERNFSYMGVRLNFTGVNGYVLDRSEKIYVVYLTGWQGKNWTLLTSRERIMQILNG